MSLCKSNAKSRKRILVCAFAFSPIRGSECAVGWNICTRLAKYFDVTVLYAESDHYLKYKDEVETFLRENGNIPGLTLVPVSHSAYSSILEYLHNKGVWVVYYAWLKRWHKQALKVAKELHDTNNYDLVHQLNMIGFRSPGFLYQVDAKFLWGPVGGASNIPYSYFPIMSLRGQLFYGIRNVVNSLQQKWLLGPRRTAKAAAKVISANQDSQRMILRNYQCCSDIVIETGGNFNKNRKGLKRKGGAIRLAWSGEHIDRKAFPILLYALEKLNGLVRYKLDVLGAGVQTKRWKNIADSLGLSQNIEWHGWVKHSMATEIVGQADLFVFTSLMEGTPHVVLEALSFGVPVVCHDACGMAEVVDEKCGVKIPLSTPADSIIAFKEAILSFYQFPDLNEKLSQGALQRASELSWDNKAKELVGIYKDLLI